MTKQPFFWGICIILLVGLVLPAGAVLVVPAGTPEPYFNASIPGNRNLGDDFTFRIDNVSNQADVVYHHEVYAARIIGRGYFYYSPAWGRWFWQDARCGSRYLAVWVRTWTEGTSSWGYGPDRFRVWVWGNLTIDPEPAHLNDLAVEYKSDRYMPVVIAELQNRTLPDGKVLTDEFYGWKDGYEQTRIESGLSNAWDGVVLYQIPDRAELADIQVAGWFGDWRGTAIWHLTEHQIDQQSPEAWAAEQTRILIRQIGAGIRLPDNAGRQRA